MTIAAGVLRLQDIALECTTVSIKSAPDWPIENVDPLPMAISRIEGVSSYVMNRMIVMLTTIIVEFHFSRVNLKLSYQQSDAIAIEFTRRLAGDPTLGGAVDTIEMNRERPLTAQAGITEWANTATRTVAFAVIVKTLESPI